MANPSGNYCARDGWRVRRRHSHTQAPAEWLELVLLCKGIVVKRYTVAAWDHSSNERPAQNGEIARLYELFRALCRYVTLGGDPEQLPDILWPFRNAGIVQLPKPPNEYKLVDTVQSLHHPTHVYQHCEHPDQLIVWLEDMQWRETTTTELLTTQCDNDTGE